MTWLSKQWNSPSRTDYYLMRIAQRISQQWSKKAVSIKEQIIPFEEAKSTKPQDPVERSKAVWIGGIKAAVKQREKQRGY